MATEYVVLTSSAHVKGKARQFGRYRNVAVCEVTGCYPKMISKRARGMVSIIRHWGACSVGKTERCQYRRALREAEALKAELESRTT